VRTSWPMLSEQTGLTPNHVEKLCRALKRKRYVWYPVHRGARSRLVDVAIHKYPLAHGGYTDLSSRFAAEVPAEVLADVAGSARAGARTRTFRVRRLGAESTRASEVRWRRVPSGTRTRPVRTLGRGCYAVGFQPRSRRLCMPARSSNSIEAGWATRRNSASSSAVRIAN
jgi:hypothetical protein